VVSLRLRHEFVVPPGVAPRAADGSDMGSPSKAMQSCFVDGWQDAFLEQAEQLVPFVANGTVVGIFFGDEVHAVAASAQSSCDVPVHLQISCSCNVPFEVFDEATSFFRGALSDALGLHLRNKVFYATNECFRCIRHIR
jgi:hypothetical protein